MIRRLRSLVGRGLFRLGRAVAPAGEEPALVMFARQVRRFRRLWEAGDASRFEGRG